MEAFLSSIDWRDVGIGAVVIAVLVIMLYSRRDDAKARQESDKLQASIWQNNIAAINESFKTASNVVSESVKSTSQGFSDAIRTLKDSQAEQRAFYISKLEDVGKEMVRLDNRVKQLESEVEDRDHRIEDLEKENRTLREEADALRVEVGRLMTKVNSAQRRDKKTESK